MGYVLDMLYAAAGAIEGGATTVLDFSEYPNRLIATVTGHSGKLVCRWEFTL